MWSALLAGRLPSAEAIGNPIREAWDRSRGLPLGGPLFHLVLGWMVPYTGSLGARILEVRPGFAEVELVERRAVRNHLGSIHAIALANLIELAGNIAVAYTLPDDARFIVRGVQVQYHKKARGRVVATSRPAVVTSAARRELLVEVEVRDAAGDVVCTGQLDTLIGPKKG
jgi:uncharacterized protein (TIGR00369 family)